MTGERGPDHQPDGHAMSGELDAIQALYDRWSGVYDWNPVLALVRPARRRAVEAMDLSPGDTVVDMGAGTGANLPLLRKAVGDTGHVIGIDASPGMLDQARARVTNAGWQNVNVLEGDIRDPTLAGPVDGICSAFVAVMYDDPRTLLEPWADLLDEGGTMAALYSGPSRRGYGPVVNALLRGYLRVFEAGWEVGTDRSPIELIARRGERVRAAMSDLAETTTHEALAAGLVKLDVGQF